MLEWAHKKAFDSAAGNAELAISRKDVEKSLIAAKQMVAIERIQQFTMTTLAEFEIPDIPREAVLFSEGKQIEDDRAEMILVSNDLVDKNFAESLKYFLEKFNYSQATFSTKTSIDQSTMSKMLSGERGPSMNSLAQIVSGFEWEVANWEAQLLITKAFEHTGRKAR
jgi:hypothetical protein